MKNKFEKWEKIREKGMWHFIFKYGVLYWGVSTAVLFSIVIPIVVRSSENVSFIKVFPLSILLFPLGGLAFGALMWIYCEIVYKKWGKRRTSG